MSTTEMILEKTGYSGFEGVMRGKAVTSASESGFPMKARLSGSSINAMQDADEAAQKTKERIQEQRIVKFMGLHTKMQRSR